MPPSIQIGGGGPGGPPQPNGPGDDTGDTEHWLQVAKDALQKAENGEEDHIESAEILKWIVGIQKLLGDRQKGAESAFGITSAHKAMSRAY